MPRILFIALLVLYVASNPLYAQKRNRGKKKQSNKEEQVLEMDRVSGERAFFEGIKYRAVDNYEEAIISFEASLSFIPTNDAAHYELAVIYFKELDFNRADYYLTQALSIDPSNTWYMAFLAEIYVGNNKLRKAVGLFENLHEMEPSKRSHLNNIAIVELMMGDTLSALDSYGEYVERYGLDDEVYG
ncbi:MAG: tetratricopeptide repeat protein, partial [Bacteroidota bacterium]|nr:tetratricopeptide repeat protein [Bacteroidota bacterium]